MMSLPDDKQANIIYCNEVPRRPVNQRRMFCSIPKPESSQTVY